MYLNFIKNQFNLLDIGLKNENLITHMREVREPIKQREPHLSIKSLTSIGNTTPMIL